MTLNGAIKQLHDLRSSDAMPVYFKPAIAEVINVLLFDVRENVRGEWLHDEVTMNGNTVYTPNAKCSICDCYVFQESDFCPNCGASMRGDNHD